MIFQFNQQLQADPNRKPGGLQAAGGDRQVYHPLQHQAGEHHAGLNGTGD